MTLLTDDLRPQYPGSPDRPSGDGSVGHSPNRQPYKLPDSELIRTKRYEIDSASGVVVTILDVKDPYYEAIRVANPYAYKYAIADRDAYREVVTGIEERLRNDPSEEATLLAQKFMYGIGDEGEDELAPFTFRRSEALEDWRSTMKEAAALLNLYDPSSPTLPSGRPVDGPAQDRFEKSVDGAEIRIRGEQARALFLNHALESNKRHVKLLSIAAGAADSAFGAMHDFKQRASRKRTIHATGVDINPKALDLARRQLSKYGLSDRDFTAVESDLVRELIGSDILANRLGEKFDVIEMVGIVDYLSTKAAARLLQKAAGMLDKDGIMVFGNIVVDHPELQFNQRGVGWPDLKIRTVAEIAEIVELAGYSREEVTYMKSENGAYVLARIQPNLLQNIEHEASQHLSPIRRLLGQGGLYASRNDKTNTRRAA